MKKQRFIPVIVLLIAAANLSLAQPQPPDTLWTRTFGGRDDDIGNSMKQTIDGGYIITGSTWSYGAGNRSIYLIKTTANGDSVWTRTFGGTHYFDYGNSVQQTRDGGYIIVGSTNSYGAGHYDVYLIKTTANGDSDWTATFGGSATDDGHSVQQTSDGGYIIAGSTSSYGVGSDDVYLVKTDAIGRQQWYQTFGGSSYDCGYSIQQTSDDGYIITGYTTLSSSNRDIYLIKTDASGNEQWSRTLGGSYNDYSYSVQQTGDGGYIIAGTTYSFGAGGSNIYLIKTDSAGNQHWQRTFGGNHNECGGIVEQTISGGYIITGGTNSFGAGDYDVYLIKADSCGDLQWQQTFGGSYWEDYGVSVHQTIDGGYIIAGSTCSWGAGELDVYLIRLAPEGSLVEDFGKKRPLTFTLHPAYPNPFNAETVIAFDLPSAVMVNLFAYDINGRKVSILSQNDFPRGKHKVNFDGGNLPSGVYFLRLQAGDFQSTRKCLLIK